MHEFRNYSSQGEQVMVVVDERHLCDFTDYCATIFLIQSDQVPL